MTTYEKRQQVETLRRKGFSLNTIAEETKVSKSTVASWCRNITLTPAQQAKLRKKQIQAGARGRLLGTEANRRRKADKIEHARVIGQKELQTLSTKEFLVAGLAIYWGEGSKTDQLSFINSDPAMLRLMMKWFEFFFSVEAIDIVPRIFISESHKDRIGVVTRYWSKELNIPVSQFRPATFNKYVPKKVYENRERHFGLVSLRIRRSTDIKYRILGLIDGLKSSNLPVSADVAQLVRASHS